MDSYLLKVVKKFNRVQNIEEQWEFIKVEIENEQVKVIERWLNGTLGDKTAKERIRSMRWLLQYVNHAQKSGKSALERIKDQNPTASPNIS